MSDKFEIRNETKTTQEVDAPGAGLKKVAPGDTVPVSAQVATGFWGCTGWTLLKNGKEIGPEIEKTDEKPKAPKPKVTPKPPKPPADPTASEE